MSKWFEREFSTKTRSVQWNRGERKEVEGRKEKGREKEEEKGKERNEGKTKRKGERKERKGEDEGKSSFLLVLPEL